MNAIFTGTRVGLRMFSSTILALLVLFASSGDSSAAGMGEVLSD